MVFSLALFVCSLLFDLGRVGFCVDGWVVAGANWVGTGGGKEGEVEGFDEKYCAFDILREGF